MNIKIKKVVEDAIIPKYQTSGSAGFDFHTVKDVTVFPKETRLISTGLAFEIPEGYELQIRPRSSISLKTKIRISNSPATIDSDYRGLVSIIVDNISSHGSLPYEIKKGDRIAQGVICKVNQAVFVESELSETERGEGGFGSTNKN
jgi:dUTP pyrophosphatase